MKELLVLFGFLLLFSSCRKQETCATYAQKIKVKTSVADPIKLQKADS